MKSKKNSVADRVFNNIKEDINNGVYQVGEKLPSENDLATKYGVSRISIRTALQRLEMLGLVDTRVGEGTFVNELDFFKITSNISELIANEHMLEYLFEFRSDIEISCLKLAMERSSNEELLSLLDIAQEMLELATKNDLENYVETNYYFHFQICKLSQNKLYEFVFSSIKDLLILGIKTNLITRSEVNSEEYVGRETMIYSAKLHIRLSSLILSGDVDQACKYLTEIINFYTVTYEED